MKALVIGIISVALMMFFGLAAYIFNGSVFIHQWWFWLVAMALMVMACAVLMVWLLKMDYDDNPYYADMVKAKRAEVHAMQKMAKESL